MIDKDMIEDIDILARTLYGEAEADNKADAEAIACVIINRVHYPNWPDDVSKVCLQPWQFTCWHDSKERIMSAKGKWFNKCRKIAEKAVTGKLKDKTAGSTHYYATYIKKPSWAKGHKFVYEVSHDNGHSHIYFNDIDTPAPQNAAQALDQNRPLSRTRTIKGGALAATGVAASEVITEIKDQIEPLVAYADTLKIVFLVVALAGVFLTVWARVDDRKKGFR